MHEFIEVEYRSGKVEYFLNPNNLDLKPDDIVIVEVERGEDIAQVIHLAISSEELEKKYENKKILNIKRLATEEDKQKLLQLAEDEAKATRTFLDTVVRYPFQMKLIDTVYQFDGNKLTFFFVADGRIDFRTFVRELANLFKTRIELHQTTGRDEARRLGGFGMCGNPYCCVRFLKQFNQVTIKMAKDQNLSGNLSKISGPCGRLLCCLNFEEDFYVEQGRDYPLLGTCVMLDGQKMFVFKIDVINERVYLTSEDQLLTDIPLAQYLELEIIDLPISEEN
ncbi:MAG TPA: regulatory iron-sulfur-containing complex subunit RicT [Candidatus Cloacimonadota bacterium]|nr:regulatory iron-sulfur-containing complex subunit RicT [Candidatus Cloacimonadota bacterium]HOV16534.1 regulatory iron-sulfur-containing complex subunit RicT [Candidatus Cloacimonadota bacterium]HQL15114.1 regulatory iron-sulfur-containing complex subunit RicT [Candidatus Cloacimonadota bacterium]